MGGLCSKQRPVANPYAGRSSVDVQKKKQHHHQQQQQQQKQNGDKSQQVVVPEESIEKTAAIAKESPNSSARFSDVSDDDFYDGIPRFDKSFYHKSRSARTAKVSGVGSMLGRAGSAGLGRAVEVLDSLGSSVNLKGGFVSGASNKSNELSILGFEVANTIVKGSKLMQSLSERSIWQLKEAVLPEEAVQNLISNDMDELLRIVASDKREELKVFAGEVIRFGNRCKDSQWHNLDRFFEKRSRDRTPQNQLRERADAVMLQLTNSVQLTSDLYQELHTLDKFEEDYRLKSLEILNAGQSGDRDNRLNIIAGKLKSQRKLVKNLKKKSLWSSSMEEVMEKLVDIVLFLNQEINYTFGNPVVGETPEEGIVGNQQKLGPMGLALHYANIILMIDAIVGRPGSTPPNYRETLYQNLPPNIRDSLRSKLQSFHIEKELTVTEIKNEMEKTLHWLVPVATNTAKAYHGFGWVGEWANLGNEQNHRSVAPSDVMQIETLHHADKQKTEAYILDLLSWLNYLISRCKAKAKGGGAVRRSIREPVSSPSKEAPNANSGQELSSTQVEVSNIGKMDATPGQELSSTQVEDSKLDDNESGQTETDVSGKSVEILG